jgi:steroid delta-isomerase-like uncharacterized protein
MRRRPHFSWTRTLLLCGALPLAAACNPTAEDRSLRELESLIDRLNAAWNAKDAEAIESLFAADAVHEDVTSGSVRRGVSAVRALFTETWRAIPDVRTQVVRVIGQEDWAAWEWTMTATHTGDFPNLPATGRRFTLVGVSIMQVKDGKILSQRDYYDQASFLRQVGALPTGL